MTNPNERIISTSTTSIPINEAQQYATPGAQVISATKTVEEKVIDHKEKKGGLSGIVDKAKEMIPGLTEKAKEVAQGGLTSATAGLGETVTTTTTKLPVTSTAQVNLPNSQNVNYLNPYQKQL